MKSAENIEKLIKNLDLNIDINEETEKVILEELIEAHEKSKQMKSVLVEPNIRRIIMKSPITKLAAAALIIIAVFVGIDQFDTNSSSVAWADVAERFESVPFIKITIYLLFDPSNKTKKIEIWKSEDSRIRAHEGNKVFFADISKHKNEFTIFDRSTKKLLNGDENLPTFTSTFIWRLCSKEGRFSLDTLTKSFPSDVKGIIPLETADTAASKETILFRAKAKEISPERLKIWALRKSKLPIRFFVRPEGGYMDLFFDYSEHKEAAFFDPVAFTNQ
ncbi:MAG: hypothetical protein ACYS6K_25505 [Planctomycetota bacterium]|jgi:hypothetical protein